MVEIASYAAPLSDDRPCGESAAGTPAMVAMDAVLTPERPRMIGGDAAPPDPAEAYKRALERWREAGAQAERVLAASRDLKAAAILSVSMLYTDGVEAFGDGVELVRGYLDRYWDEVHPALEADFDPYPRRNAFEAFFLSDAVDGLRRAPLARDPKLGGVATLEQIELASSRAAGAAEAARAAARALDAAAISGDDAAALADRAAAAKRARDGFAALEETWSAKMSALAAWSQTDAGRAARGVDFDVELSFAPLTSMLDEIVETLSARDGRAAVGANGLAHAASSAGLSNGDGKTAMGVGSSHSPVSTQAPTSAPGAIATRDDAVAALSAVAAWFRANEPSSPVAAIVERASRLVAKSFVEILEDLGANGIEELKKAEQVADDAGAKAG